jgi:hypothetical protein
VNDARIFDTKEKGAGVTQDDNDDDDDDDDDDATAVLRRP